MGVVGIDYGTESMKISLVKPGEPFDVVLSRDSKRKIPSAVAWKVQERLYGSDAANLASRYPGDTFIGAKFLLGREYNDELAKARFAGLLDTRLVPNSDRNGSTISIQRETDYTINKEGADVYSIEEIVGTQFGHAKTLAEEQAGEEVVRKYPGSIGTFGGLDVAITVPIFYTAAERQSIYDAAQIAGIKPRLVSDGTAVAVNYAMTRTFVKPERHMFFDAGAGSSSATIVEFSTKTVQADSILSIGATQKESIVIDVLGAGWDREANGMALDLIVREELARQFQAKHAKQITKPLSQQPRAMARLLKEANRVKHILSANTEATSYVEMLADEIDFRGSITRETFEKLVSKAGLSPRFGRPAKDALASAGLTLKDIDSVVLVGGATRIPLVQASLRDAGISDDKIAQNVNADEAAVMGAAFYGASFNPQFRMKAIKANDGTPYSIVIKEPTGNTATLFAAKAIEAVSSTRTYPDVFEDFSVQLAYDQTISKSVLDGQKHELYTVEVSGIHKQLADLKSEGHLNNVEVSVNLTLTTEPLGTIRVDKSYLHVKQKPGGLVGALKGFFNVGQGHSSEEDGTEDPTDENANSTSSDGSNSTASQKKEKKKEMPSERHIVLDAAITNAGSLHAMSSAELKSATDRLYVANVLERKKAAREEARNVLEAYLYRMRDTVEEGYFQKASKPAERSAIKGKLQELSDWLSGDGDEADTSMLKVKRASLESLVKPIEKRITEQRVRGKAVRTFEKATAQAQTFITEARANLTEAMAANLASKFTVAEIDSFEEQLKKDKKWYDEKSKAQAKRSLDEDVVLPSDDVEKRAKKLVDTVKRYNKRRVPKARPPKKEAPKKADAEQQTPITADVDAEIPAETPVQSGDPTPPEGGHARHEEL
jgi:hypoxia up-regulated 1